MNEHKPISEKSTITISFLVILIGGIFWLASMNSLAQNTSAGLSELKGFIYNELRAIRQELTQIRDRLPAK